MQAEELELSGARAEEESESHNATNDAYNELLAAYDYYNEHLFGGELPGCLLTLQRNKRFFGFFSNKRFVNGTGGYVDEIALNPSVFAVRPVEAVLSTLVHECVHQWQAHFGKAGRRGYHNAEWADKMESIGLIPSSTGRPGGKRIGEQMTHYINPEGPFFSKTRELLEGGFRLSWYDRFPTAMDLPIYVGSEAEEDLLSALPPAEDTPDNPRTVLGADDGLTDNLAGLNGKTALSEPPVRAGIQVSKPDLTAVRNSKTTRLKFICPGCQDAAWGKPSLQLVCGKCQQPFAAPQIAELQDVS